MSEQNTIPTEMLDAATEAIAATQYCSQWGAGKLAEVALEAAGVPALLERVAGLEAEIGEANLIAEARSVVGMDLLAEADQQEARIAELEAALRKIVHSQDVAMPIEFDEEIAELLKPMGAGGEQ